jgi:myo-inositol-1(or 4)-monophosphatase
MKSAELKKALACAVDAAQQAGALMCRNHGVEKKINSRSKHDIKLDLDVRCQKLIEGILLKAFPESGLLGEEGLSGKAEQALRWVVDPIDGTVNFTYGVPHACVSIALQERDATGDYATVVGVIYDPFCDELWTASSSAPARLNGKIIHVSQRTELREAIVSIGFAKDVESLRTNLPVFNALVSRVMKMRMMGSAALSLVYVASGRFDVCLESGIRIWDIAAAGFIIERAGGEFWREKLPATDKFQMLATNGLLRGKVERIAREARKEAAD